MLIHSRARKRSVVALILGALLLVATERSGFAQDAQAQEAQVQAVQATSTAAQPAQDSSSAAASPPLNGFLSEPHVITNSINEVTKRFGDGSAPPKSGFYPELSNMVTGSGFVSVGPGYRQYFDNDRMLIDGSAAISWHSYLMAQGRIERRKLAHDHVTVGAQGMWQDDTQVNYFGIGPNSNQAAQSQYRLQNIDVVGYATIKPKDWLSIGGVFGWMQPAVLAPSGSFSGNYPSTQTQFPNDPAVSLSSQPSFLHGQASIVSDTRDHRGYPSSGGMYRAAATSFADQSGSTFSFSQYEVEGAQFIPVAERRWVLAFRGWALYSAIPTNHEIPFYLMPSLGGNNTLRAFDSYRFHDNNLLDANAESRFALYDHVDVALFIDAGNVAAQFTNLDLNQKSYGVGVRLHTRTTTLARLNVAYGTEGWAFVFRTTNPFGLSRVRRYIALAPFAP